MKEKKQKKEDGFVCKEQPSSRGLRAKVSKITFEIEATKEVADKLKWLCWNAGLSYPDGISVLLDELVAKRHSEEVR